MAIAKFSKALAPSSANRTTALDGQEAAKTKQCGRICHGIAALFEFCFMLFCTWCAFLPVFVLGRTPPGRTSYVMFTYMCICCF